MAKLVYDKNGRLIFTKEMKEEYTILMPQMLPVHFGMMKRCLEMEGYKVDMLNTNHRAIVNTGLKYVHNDTCYPALLVIGQLIEAIQSGKYDVNKTALIITQTGGGCRASNYIHLLRKALHKAGYDKVPVISLNVSGLEKNSGFKLTLPLIRQAMAALVYGDMLMLLSNQVKPYETEPGRAMALVEEWSRRLVADFSKGNGYGKKEIAQNLQKIASDFNDIPVQMVPKVKVGVVGEIYVKYSRLGNNNLEELLAQEGCEVMIPGILNFVMYSMEVNLDDIALYGGSKAKAALVRRMMAYLCSIEKAMIDAVKQYPRFQAPSPFYHTKSLAKGIIGYGCKMGEGWLLTAEMAELIDAGYGNIICTQPFGCLPNHIVGKGMIRKLKEVYPISNIVPIDYDPSATSVNQENRIKLMLAIARENLQAGSPRPATAQPIPQVAPSKAKAAMEPIPSSGGGHGTF